MSGPTTPHADEYSDAEKRLIQRRTVQTLLASQVCGGIGLVSGISVTVLLAYDLSGSKTVAGLTAACLSVGAAVVSFPLARLMARAGRRPGLLAGYLVGSAGTFVAALAALTGVYLLLPFGVLAIGAASAANLATRYAAADLARDDRRASTIGLIVWASTIGSGFGSLFSLWLIDPAGRSLGLPEYAGPYLIGAVLLLAAAAIVGLRLRPDPLVVAGGIRQASQPRLPFTRSMALILAHPRARIAVLAMALVQAVMVGTMTLTPLHMKDGHQGGTAISVLLFGHIMGMYLLSPVVGVFADRFGRYPMLFGAGVLCVFGALYAGATPAHEFAGLALGQAAIGLAWCMGVISASGLLTESFPVTQRASVQGAGDLCMAACGAIAGVSAGGIVASRSYLDLNVVAAVLGGILVVAVLYTVVANRGRPAIAMAS